MCLSEQEMSRRRICSRRSNYDALCIDALVLWPVQEVLHALRLGSKAAAGGTVVPPPETSLLPAQPSQLVRMSSALTRRIAPSERNVER